MSVENMMPSNTAEAPDTENVFEEAALDFGLRNVVFPKVGTEAYKRLRVICGEYSREVFNENTSHRIDMGKLENSQTRRRRLHNQLCIMVFGLDHEAVSKKDPDDLQRVANMAHSISGREQLIVEV